MKRLGLLLVVGVSACVGLPPSAPEGAATTTGPVGSSSSGSPGGSSSTTGMDVDSSSTTSMQTGGETTGAVMEETSTGEPPTTGGQESSSGEALPGLPEVGCRQEGLLTSTASTTPSIVTFHNDSGEVRRLYWLDTAGERFFLLEYAPGQVEDWNSFVTHAFLVADDQDQCITIFVLDQEGEYEVSLY